MSEHPGIARFRAEHERLGGTGRIVTLPDSVHTAALAAEALGCEVRVTDGVAVGVSLGAKVGDDDGVSLGSEVGDDDGVSLGCQVGVAVGRTVGSALGTCQEFWYRVVVVGGDGAAVAQDEPREVDRHS